MKYVSRNRPRPHLSQPLDGLWPSNLELWQRESAQAREQCAQMTGRRAERMRACERRRCEVDLKYGQQPDVFYEATIA